MRIAALLVLSAFATANAASASDSCMTKGEARKHFGSKHLYWHGAERCWDATPTRHGARQSRATREARRIAERRAERVERLRSERAAERKAEREKAAAADKLAEMPANVVVPSASGPNPADRLLKAWLDLKARPLESAPPDDASDRSPIGVEASETLAPRDRLAPDAGMATASADRAAQPVAAPTEEKTRLLKSAFAGGLQAAVPIRAPWSDRWSDVQQVLPVMAGDGTGPKEGHWRSLVGFAMAFGALLLLFAAGLGAWRSLRRMRPLGALARSAASTLDRVRPFARVAGLRLLLRFELAAERLAALSGPLSRARDAAAATASRYATEVVGAFGTAAENLRRLRDRATGADQEGRGIRDVLDSLHADPEPEDSAGPYRGAPPLTRDQGMALLRQMGFRIEDQRPGTEPALSPELRRRRFVLVSPSRTASRG